MRFLIGASATFLFLAAGSAFADTGGKISWRPASEFEKAKAESKSSGKAIALYFYSCSS